VGAEESEQREIVASLRAASPRVVVRRHADGEARPGGAIVGEYLEGAYELDRRIGRGYEVLRLR